MYLSSVSLFILGSHISKWLPSVKVWGPKRWRKTHSSVRLCVCVFVVELANPNNIRLSQAAFGFIWQPSPPVISGTNVCPSLQSWCFGSYKAFSSCMLSFGRSLFNKRVCLCACASLILIKGGEKRGLLLTLPSFISVCEIQLQLAAQIQIQLFLHHRPDWQEGILSLSFLKMDLFRQPWFCVSPRKAAPFCSCMLMS